MPVFDSPITTDDQHLQRVIGQQLPTLLILHRGDIDKPLQDALRKEAKRHAGDLLVVRVDIAHNPDTLLRYGSPNVPALVTFTADGTVKSDAESVRPKDVRDHLKHLLHDTPLPKVKSPSSNPKHPITVTDQTFRDEVLKNKTPVLVDFWATWCGPCLQIAPHIERMARDYGDKVKIAKLDVDQNRVIAERYGIRSIPTMIMFESGQIAERITGANPNALKRMVQKFAQ